MKAILADALYVPKAYIEKYPAILQAFSYRFETKVDFGYDNYDENPVVEDWVHMYRDAGEYYAFSRGNVEKIFSIFHELEIIDRRSNVPFEFLLQFTGTLKPDQKLGLRTFTDPNIGGIFQARPGYGKTVVMNALLTLIQQKTILFVNKTDLKTQFMDRMRTFTNLNELEAQLGRPLMGELSYDSEGNPIDFPITVTTYQLVNFNVASRLKAIQNRFGLVMVDECHRAPARCLTHILKYMNPLLFVGMSATPKRKDNYHILLPDLIGPVRFQSIQSNTCAVEIVAGEYFPFKDKVPWPIIIGAVCKNPDRNQKIVDHVKADIAEGHRVLVLTDRVKHVDLLKAILQKEGVAAGGITGGTDREGPIEQFYHLEKAIEHLQTQTSVADEVNWDVVITWKDFWDEVRDLALSDQLKADITKLYNTRVDVVVATSKLFGEGSDIPCISCLHIVTPTANPQFLEQSIGRVQREYLRKLPPKAVYYAYGGCGILYGCGKKVRRVCKDLKYQITGQNAPTEDEDIYKV